MADAKLCEIGRSSIHGSGLFCKKTIDANTIVLTEHPLVHARKKMDVVSFPGLGNDAMLVPHEPAQPGSAKRPCYDDSSYMNVIDAEAAVAAGLPIKLHHWTSLHPPQCKVDVGSDLNAALVQQALEHGLSFPVRYTANTEHASKVALANNLLIRQIAQAFEPSDATVEQWYALFASHAFDVPTYLHTITYGRAFYPILAHINHACRPNAELFFVAGVAILRLLRDVAAGEELTISYVPIGLEFLIDRGTQTQRLYGFTCVCPDCVSGWRRADGVYALHESLPNRTDLPTGLSGQTELQGAIRRAFDLNADLNGVENPSFERICAVYNGIRIMQPIFVKSACCTALAQLLGYSLVQLALVPSLFYGSKESARAVIDIAEHFIGLFGASDDGTCAPDTLVLRKPFAEYVLDATVLLYLAERRAHASGDTFGWASKLVDFRAMIHHFTRGWPAVLHANAMFAAGPELSDLLDLA